MNQEKNIGIARQLLAGLVEGKDPAAIAALFGENVIVEIPGDSGALPWIGRTVGRKAVADFIQGLQDRKPVSPTFRDALETQYVCDAVLKSGRSGRWEKVGGRKG